MEKIEDSLKGVKKNVSLKSYTTFKIGGRAEYFFALEKKEDLAAAILAAKKTNLPFFILGAGSNLLVSDAGFAGLVIKMQNTRYKTKDTKIKAGAGVKLGDLVIASARKSLSGLEWSVGIPGSVGGAVRGNAGAFGYSMRDIVESVEALDIKSLKFKNYNSKECEFDYRQSIFKKNKNLIIFSAELKLKKENGQEIKEKVKENLKYRDERHPKEPSAGSVFKNFSLTTENLEPLVKKFPEFLQFKERGNIPAAFLISESGQKGKTIGGAKISEQHPNFILNFNDAKSKDVKDLINLAKKSVKNKFGINLEEEIVYL